MDTKITEISAILALKETAKAIAIKKDTERKYKETMMGIAFFAGCVGLLIIAGAADHYMLAKRAINIAPKA